MSDDQTERRAESIYADLVNGRQPDPIADTLEDRAFEHYRNALCELDMPGVEEPAFTAERLARVAFSRAARGEDPQPDDYREFN